MTHPAHRPGRPASALAREARLLAYSSGNFGKALVFSGADMTILFLLTDLLGLGAGEAGALMLVALAGDLVFDLVAAALVIRLRRQGRGYRWMVMAGAVPCALAFAMLYAMPASGLRQGGLLALAMLVFRGAYAVIDVPHNALMAQMTHDSRARGRVSGYRLGFSTASSLCLALVLAPLVQQAARSRAFAALALTGAGAGALFALTMALCVLASGRTASSSARAAGEDTIRVPLRDPLVVGLGLLALITGFAMPTFGRMVLYIGTYVVARGDLVPTLLLAMTGGQFAGVLVWTALTARLDQARVLVLGHGVSAFGLLLFGLCLGHPPALVPCAAVIGFGLAAVFMLPWGLLANAVDFLALRHGRRLETGLFAAYLVAVKASGAAATALVGYLLGALGYVPGAGQTPQVLAAMLGLGLGLPLTGSLAAFALLPRFALGHARHARVRTALERRAQPGAEPVSGLKRGLAKSIGEGSTLAGGAALSAQARQSMSRSIAAPAAVRS
ncbi:MFS transporter [Novosphingobium profundi]|nr:MFS transporter [Novosphingobium profundi]